jgi:hypothetical protein
MVGRTEGRPRKMRKKMTQHPVIVDTSLGLKGLMEAIENAWVLPSILDPRKNPPSVIDRGKYQVSMDLLTLGTDMTAEEAVVFTAGLGFRPALPEETLAYGAVHAEWGSNGFMCISAFWGRHHGAVQALTLHENEGERAITLATSLSDRWGRRNRIAVVRL